MAIFILFLSVERVLDNRRSVYVVVRAVGRYIDTQNISVQYLMVDSKIISLEKNPAVNGNAFRDSADNFIGCLMLAQRRLFLINICLCLLLEMCSPAPINIKALNIACVTRWARATMCNPALSAIVIIPSCLIVE